MSTRTTLHRLALASAVAAMLAAATPGAFAQTPDAMTPPATSTPTDTAPSMPAMPGTPNPAGGGGMSTTPTTPAMPGSTASMPMSGGTMSPMNPGTLPTDYSILNNKVFDGVDLQQSRARGFSDNQIATIVKISKLTGYPFRQISGEVGRGKTFPVLASAYNLRLNDVYSVDKEKQEVADYDALNQYAMSLSKGSGSMASMPMGSTAPMPMDSTPPMTTPPMTTAPAQLDIVETAMAAKNLSTLVKALQAAGLVETLKGAGPFTVFAPDNKAFSKLPAGALDALLADPAKLKQVLTYHVIPANVKAADAMAMTDPTSPPTVEGATLQVTKGKKGKLKINDATVTKADIEASNGTIHIIDTVLMPPADAAMPAQPMTDTPPAAPAPMDATPPTAPATPDTTTPPAPAPTDATPPAAPATPDTTTPPATPNTMTPPATDPNAPATPTQ